jgi:long-chain fatty acid transport protein
MVEPATHVSRQQHIFPLLPLLGTLLLAFGLCRSAWASGFRITNQSLGAVGLSGAHIAYTPGPDASYYNPANMPSLADRWRVETSLTTLALPSITYTDNRGPALNGDSENELFFMPLVHAVSPHYNNLRFGFSLTYPYGLSKRWDQPYPRASAKEFSLLIIEANPTVAYQVNPWLSVGGGLSVIYGEGEVDSEVTNPPFPLPSPLTALNRSSDGSDTQLGYNLALSLRPSDKWTLAATYRSEVDLSLAGHGDLQALMGGTPLLTYAGSSAIDLTLPAVLSLATAYTVDRLTVEIGWDRTFWSSFENLDFQYDQDLLGTPFDPFDRAVVKNWDDTDAFRLGLSVDWNERWTTTVGLAYDETPVPSDTLGFELPDTDATVYCAGLRYRASPAMELGLSYMYHRTRTRSVAQTDGIDGTFTDGGAHAVTVGLITSF